MYSMECSVPIRLSSSLIGWLSCTLAVVLPMLFCTVFRGPKLAMGLPMVFWIWTPDWTCSYSESC